MTCPPERLHLLRGTFTDDGSQDTGRTQYKPEQTYYRWRRPQNQEAPHSALG